MLLIIMVLFTYDKREMIKLDHMIKHQEVSKYYDHDCMQNFILLLMSLLTTSIVKISRILDGIYFIFLNKRLRPNLKGIQYQIWTSMKR